MGFDLTASRHLLPFADFLTKSGEPLERLLRTAHLPINCLDDPKKLLPTASLWHFRELAAIRTGLPNLTLSVIEPLDLSDLGAVGKSLIGLPTLMRTIQHFRRLAHTESSTAVLELSPFGQSDVFFSVRFVLESDRGRWQAELYLLLWMLKIVRLVAAPDWSPREICCCATATPDRLYAIESLGARPRFNFRRTGFPIPISMLAAPQRTRRPEERRSGVDEQILWSTAPSRSASGGVKQLIQAYSNEDWLTVQEASESLGVNLRTLQRQLAKEGQSYSAILEETRAENASKLLEETDASLTEIGRSLGYSNLSNFNRAFRRWAGVSPRKFREQRGGTPCHSVLSA